ncbi:MAG: hypothetical protein FWJ70_02045 [Micromonosporaceae bacterium]
MPGSGRPRRHRPLRAGELVRVRSREEILSTLDADGDLGGLPFMPEMLRYAGQEFRVQARAHKTCDTVTMTGTSRRLERTVHLAGLRCDGSAHGGCQAGCLLFWREEWLARPGDPPLEPRPALHSEETLRKAAVTTDADGEPVYRCQATRLPYASRHLSGFDPRQYVKDLWSGNVRLPALVRGLSITAFNKLQQLSRRLPRRLRFRDGDPYPFYRGTGDGKRTPAVPLSPGDLVEVRSRDEIMATLSPRNTNGGLWFDCEMLPYCGTRARVARHVERIINEATGRMMRLSDCVVLDGVVCTGRYRRFCPRAVTPYWRSAWLRRIDEPSGG